MSKGERLRALVSERLTAAAEEIFSLVERTIAEYEEELRRSKEENQRRQQLLEEALRPKVHTQSSEVQIQTESPNEAVFFKEEEEGSDTCVIVKNEEFDTEDNEWSDLPDSDVQMDMEALAEAYSPVYEAPLPPAAPAAPCGPEAHQTTAAEQDSSSPQTPTSDQGPSSPAVAPQTIAADQCYVAPTPLTSSLELSDRTKKILGKRKRRKPRRVMTPAEEKNPQQHSKENNVKQKEVNDEQRGAEERSPTSSPPEKHAEVKGYTTRKKDLAQTPAQNFQILCTDRDEAGPSLDGVDAAWAAAEPGQPPLTAATSNEHVEQRDDTDPEDWSYDWSSQPGSSRQLLDTDDEAEDFPPMADNPFLDFTGKKLSIKSGKPASDAESKVKHECPICRKKLGRKQELKRHMLLHTGEKPFSCPVCDKRFIQKSNLKSHIVTHLDSVDTIIRFQKPMETSRGENEEDWRNTDGELTLDAREKLMDKLSDSDDDDWTQALEPSASGSSQHMEHEPEDEQDSGSLERISLLLHQALNESKAQGKTTEFQCPMCDKMFSRMENLRRHLLVHTGEKAFSCPVCNKQFTLKQHLKLHMVLHTRDQQFACSVCAKTFIRKDNLRSHMRIHSTDRPFGCSQCGARFYTDQDLARHTAHHTGERPFVCPVCNSGFLSQRYLNRHVKIHKKEAEKSNP